MGRQLIRFIELIFYNLNYFTVNLLSQVACEPPK